MSTAWTSVEIFCSYAHEDKPFLDELQKHLSLSQRQGLITTWYDRLILPGGTPREPIQSFRERNTFNARHRYRA